MLEGETECPERWRGEVKKWYDRAIRQSESRQEAELRCVELQAEAEQLRARVAELERLLHMARRRIRGKDGLLTAHRCGGQPTRRAWKDLDDTATFEAEAARALDLAAALLLAQAKPRQR